MGILVASSGSYPRLGINSVGHELRKAWHEYDSGKKTLAEVKAIEDLLVEEIIKEQEEIGVDLVTDGLVRWYCPVSHIAGRMQGVKSGTLHHFLDTNFHVRKAIVEDWPRWIISLVEPEFSFAKSRTPKTVKAVLCGPATLLRYTGNLTSYPMEEIGRAYTEALKEELCLLSKAGASFIHIDDPVLLEEKERWSYFCDLYSELRNSCRSAFIELKTYGAPSAFLLEDLMSLPVDIIGVDCVTDKEVLFRLATESKFMSQKIFALGIVDSKTGFMESPEKIASLAEGLLRESENLIIEPSYGLENIERRFVRAKLRVLSEAKRLLEGRSQKETQDE